jgi:hypothetical protein
MVRAVVKGGVIVPLSPLPPEWSEGTELTVQQIEESPSTPEEIDAWAREMDALCADSDPDEDEKLQAFLDERHRHDRRRPESG